MEGKPGLIECSVVPNPCTLQRVCSVRGNWQLISLAIETALDSVSLEALAKPMLWNGVEIKKIHQVLGAVDNSVE